MDDRGWDLAQSDLDALLPHVVALEALYPPEHPIAEVLRAARARWHVEPRALSKGEARKARERQRD